MIYRSERAGLVQETRAPQSASSLLGPSSGFLTAPSSIACSQELATAAGSCPSTPSALMLWELGHPPAPDRPWDILFPFPPDDTPCNHFHKAEAGDRLFSWKHLGCAFKRAMGMEKGGEL